MGSGRAFTNHQAQGNQKNEPLHCFLLQLRRMGTLWGFSRGLPGFRCSNRLDALGLSEAAGEAENYRYRENNAADWGDWIVFDGEVDDTTAKNKSWTVEPLA